MQYTIERGARILPGSSWQPVMRRSVDAFSQGRVAEGRDACLALLAEPGLPGNIRELTYRNQSFYAQPLSELVAGAHWTTVAALELAGWVGREPSPVWAGERLLVVLRGPERTEPAGSGHVLLVVDDALRVSEATVLGDETGEAQRTDPPVLQWGTPGGGGCPPRDRERSSACRNRRLQLRLVAAALPFRPARR